MGVILAGVVAVAVGGVLWPRRALWLSPVPDAGSSVGPNRSLLVLAGALLLAVSALVPGAGLAAAVAALGALGGRRWRQGRARRQHAAAVERAAGELTELIGLALGAGCSIAEAVDVAAREGPVVLRPQLQDLLAMNHAGTPLGLLMRELPARFGPSYRPLAGVLGQGLTDGGPVGAVLAQLADEARRRRRQDLEARLGQLPVALLVPVALTGLPAVILGAVVPLILVTAGDLVS